MIARTLLIGALIGLPALVIYGAMSYPTATHKGVLMVASIGAMMVWVGCFRLACEVFGNRRDG